MRQSQLGVLITAYLAFIGLGLPDAVTGVAWPSIRDEFGREQDGLGLILSSIAAGYLVSSAFSGALVKRLGVGWLLTLSTLAVVAGLLGWAAAPQWPLLVASVSLLGIGGGAIDAAMNLYVATRFGARHLNWLHAFYGIGATLGPILMATVLATTGGAWRTGIVIIAGGLMALSLWYGLTRRAWDIGSDNPAAPTDETLPATTMAGTLGNGRVWLQILAFFILTGFEATAGQWSFTLLTEARGLSTAAAGLWVGAFWAAFTAGRIAAGFVVDRIGGVRLTRIGTGGLLVGAVLFAANPTVTIGGLGLVICGLSIAPLFPGLMSETPRRLGPDVAAHAVGFQVSGAIFGAAAVPGVAGVAAGSQGLTVVPILLVGLAVLIIGLNEWIVARLDRGT